MVQLQKDIKKLEDAKIQVIAVSYDPVEALAKFAKSPKAKIAYTLLSDPESKVIKAFGVYNKEVAKSRIAGVPYPGTFILDEKGVIRAKLFFDGYRARHDADAIIKAAKKIK